MQVIMDGVMRSAFAFISLLVLTRLLGRRQSSQLTFFEYITGAAIGAMGAIIATNLNVSIWGAFAALLTFVVLMILNGYLTLESRPLRKLLQGEALVVIQNGNILGGNLAMVRYSSDDLVAILKERGFSNMAEVEYAIIESDGKLNIIPKHRSSAINPEDAGGDRQI
ncbi:MAG TPA: YetF domain-containing protein [Desulfobacteria bacterium]|nr:YetF domain-containing protein [Desulfobacteria bacterium]